MTSRINRVISKECSKVSVQKLSLRSLSSSTFSSRIPSSFSFSGAGFLGCYHVGASDCLMKHGFLMTLDTTTDQLQQQQRPILTGVSAGALIVAGLSAGVSTDDSMNVVLEVARRTREETGILDNFQPGFSLVDQLEGMFTSTLVKALGGSDDSSITNIGDYDWELLMKRTNNGKLMRIGLTNFNKFQISNIINDKYIINPAYVYVDQFRDLRDLLSACILSSYIPFGTGPLDATNGNNNNTAVKRATKHLKAMTQLGFVKCGTTGQPLKLSNHTEQQSKNNTPKYSSSAYLYLDGGLVENWPVVDSQTLIITPVHGNYHPNPYIAPQNIDASGHPRLTIKAREGALVDVTAENAKTLALMLKSSSDEKLQSYFRNGYDDARRFLEKNNLLKTHTSGGCTI